MQLSQPLTAAELARQTGARLVGDGSVRITGVNEIHHVRPGDLCYVDFEKYYQSTLDSAASVILIDREWDCPAGKALLVVRQPFAVFNTILEGARPRVPWPVDGIDPSATVGADTYVAPSATVGAGAAIGVGCRIGPGVVIGDGCRLGDRVTVGANSVIGGEAFYFKKSAAGYTPWRSVGGVHLEDDVEVGPGCTIARGVTAVTVIGRGSKLDAQVQVGHDCVVGPHCLLASQVGIAGNTRLGEWCVLYGQVGVAQNLVIGDRVVIGAKSGVSKNLPEAGTYFGYPAQKFRDQLREWAYLRKLRQGG